MSCLILSSYFTKKAHPNNVNDTHVVGRADNNHVKKDFFPYIEKWYNSILKNDLDAVLFHDELSEEFVSRYETDKIKFNKIGDFIYSNNDYRFFCFRDFLKKSEHDFIFHTDASDVVVVKDPSKLFRVFEEYSYFACKDSIKLNQFPYFSIHRKYNWKDTVKCLLHNHSWDLINMGVIGGRREDMILFYNKFCQIRIKMGDPNFNSDMWVLQYLLRVVFSNKKFLMGEPVCSQFKKYEDEREDVYFIHK